MARSTETATGLKLGVMPTIFVAVAALYFAQSLLIPLALAILLSFALAPVVTWLERCRVGRIAAVLIAVGMALAMVGTIGWIVERQFVEVAEKLPDYGANIQSKLRRFHGAAAGSFSKAARGVEDTFARMASSQPSTAPSATAGSTPLAQAPDSHPGEPSLPRVSPQNPFARSRIYRAILTASDRWALLGSDSRPTGQRRTDPGHRDFHVA